MALDRDLRKYEDWVLLLATFLAALSQGLSGDQRFALAALIIGAFAKALFSLISEKKGER
jgi:uncharacterized membrane protein YjjP (DUF1212 family)